MRRRAAVTVSPDRVRVVFPARVGSVLLVGIALTAALLAGPVATTAVVGLGWGVPWAIVAVALGGPVVRSLGRAARPRFDVVLELRRLAIGRSWLGVRGHRLAYSWDELADVDLYGPVARPDPADEAELVLIGPEGERIATGVRATLAELKPLAGRIRSMIRDHAGAADPSPELARLGGVVRAVRRSVR
ncbi:MAG: hypothetical protein ABMB14_15280 [Myxococcota bacterium]